MDIRRKQTIFKSARAVDRATRAIGSMERSVARHGLESLDRVPLEHMLGCDSSALDALRELLSHERHLLRSKLGIVGELSPAALPLDQTTKTGDILGLQFLRSTFTFKPSGK
jgi:hypothetical protein